MNVYLHLPKTGGTSMLQTLELILGERLFIFNRKEDLKRYDRGFVYKRDFTEIPDGTQIFMGHYIISDFPKTYDGKFMTMFRDPVERVISSYHHEFRHGTYNGTIIDYIHDNRTNQNRKVAVNMYASAIGSIYAFEKFAYIGITEYFSESIRLLCAILEIEYKSEFLHIINVNPEKVMCDKYDTEREIKETIKLINRMDYDYYNKACDYFYEMCSKYNIKIGE